MYFDPVANRSTQFFLSQIMFPFRKDYFHFPTNESDKNIPLLVCQVQNKAPPLKTPGKMVM